MVRRGPCAWTTPCLNVTHGTKACSENLPIPHPNLNCRNRAPLHNVQANFSTLLIPWLPIRGIRGCGIEAFSKLAPHLKQWYTLGCRFWMGLG